MTEHRPDDTFGPMVDQAIDDGDWGTVIAATLGARFAAEDGRYCECPEPLVAEGRNKSTMCSRCLLTNRARLAAVNEMIRAPHPFEPDPDPTSAAARLGMCTWCTGWRDDPRHTVSATDTNQRGTP